MLEFPAIMHDEQSTVPAIILAPSYERCLADVDHATSTDGLWDGWHCLVLGTEGAPDSRADGYCRYCSEGADEQPCPYHH